jgi:osmoprotectant transport system ATP-binding protein
MSRTSDESFPSPPVRSSGGFERAQGPGPAIVFDGVHLTRGTMPVLRGVDLAITAGETLALVGRSGAGKSTILKLINRMLVQDRGEVLVQGRPTHEWDPFDLRRHIGYVLQEVGLFPHLTVRDNVALVPRLLGRPEATIAARVQELLDLVGLPPGEYADRWPQALSGGQKQRVGVARALAADPPILLMDEPFGALDPVTRSELHVEFRRIQARLRKTIVIVTHDMAEALSLATRIGVLADGVLVALDPPAAIARSGDSQVRAMLAPLVEAAGALHPGEGHGGQ